MNKTFGNYQDYVALLATLNKKIAFSENNRSFFRNSEDLINPAKTVLKLNGFSGSVVKETIQQYASSMLFLKHVSGTGTQISDKIEAAQVECFDIMMEFYTRIFEETEHGSLTPQGQASCSFIETLLNPTFAILESPYMEGFYGWQMILRFQISIPDYQPSNWN